MRHHILAAISVSGLLGSVASGATIDTVPVGNAGNAADTHALGWGGVTYDYRIGTYEVTAGQYTEFLNKVAATDTYGLYNIYMSMPEYGCGITRSGSSGSYTYSVASDWVNRPVILVGFWDACRFANWLHNGQPTGPQGTGTTDTGAYTLTIEGMENNTVTRNTDWRWAVTSENEWYKAAYHKNDGVTGNYFDYPTSSDDPPGCDMEDISGNNANYWPDDPTPHNYPIIPGKYTTVAGEFQNSVSPYGTFDQGGNVWEWNDTMVYGVQRCKRGSSFDDHQSDMIASSRDGDFPTFESVNLGFRVVQVPEPATLSLLAIGGLTLIRRKRR